MGLNGNSALILPELLYTEIAQRAHSSLTVHRDSMSIATFFLALSAFLYTAAKILSHREPDYRKQDPQEQEVLSEETTESLLNG